MGDLTTGLTTAEALDATPPHFRVTWIGWDSLFRKTGLNVGDRILAVNGAPVVSPADPAPRSRMLYRAIGQSQEYQGWSEAGLATGSKIALKVSRQYFPAGWSDFEVVAPLAEAAGYRDENNCIVLGKGGPDTMASDTFSESWGGWYEKMVTALSRALDPAQRTGTFVTRFEWRQLGEQSERVVFAAKQYPGAWSEALQNDFLAARTLCAGEKITLPPGALDFRRRGEELDAQVRAKAQTAWDTFKSKVAAETIAPFPAINPVRGDSAPVVGKVVVLPPLGNSQWVSEAGHGWFAAGSEEDGWYFLDAEAEAAQAMLIARSNYAQIVDPSVAAQFEFVARITPDSRLVVVDDLARFGLLAEPVAALVGGSMFVDLTVRHGTEVQFEGEDVFLHSNTELPPDDASPVAVLSALIDAIKMDDITLWRALHADWSVERREDGQQVIYPHTSPPDDSNFEESRRSLAGRVLDVRVAWVDNPVIVADRNRFPGAMHIEEVAAELDHFGDFDGETRSFVDVTVQRRWRLQRVDGGPWRVATAQPI